MSLRSLALIPISSLIIQTAKLRRARSKVLRSLIEPPPYRLSGKLVSVVIPARDESKYIGNLFKSLSNQTYSNLEVIVANYSMDDTGEIARGYGAKVFDLDRSGVGYARNEGAKHASSDILLFLDADIVLRHDAIEKLKDKLDEGYVLSHPRILGYGSSLAFDATQALLESLKPIWWNTRAIMVRRSVFESVNGFKEIEPGEDRDFGWRVMEKYGWRSIGKVNEYLLAHSYRRWRRKGVVKGIWGTWEPVR